MTITAEVVQLGTRWYSLCRPCEWRSAPQDSQSDALDRAVVHDFFYHKDPDPEGDPPFDGKDESLLAQIEASP